MQDNYDPHNDLDRLRQAITARDGNTRPSLTQCVDRIRNWIDEAAWNTDQKFTDQGTVTGRWPSKAPQEAIPQEPLGARGKAVNEVFGNVPIPRTYEQARKERDGYIDQAVAEKMMRETTPQPYDGLTSKIVNVIQGEPHEGEWQKAKQLRGLHDLLNVKDKKLAEYEVSTKHLIKCCDEYAKREDQVRKMWQVQKDPDNRNANEHMYGMFIAFELAVATLDGREPDMLKYEGKSERVELQTTITTLTQLLGGMQSVERQMNDVRSKNTALEANNIELKETNAHLLFLNIRLTAQCKDHRTFGEGLQQGRQAAIDAAYKRGVNEGKTEARQEQAYMASDTGTFACPICGKDNPHTHTREEIRAFNAD